MSIKDELKFAMSDIQVMAQNYDRHRWALLEILNSPLCCEDAINIAAKALAEGEDDNTRY